MIELETITKNKLHTLNATRNEHTNFDESLGSTERNDFIVDAYKRFFKSFQDFSENVRNVDFAGSFARECNRFGIAFQKDLIAKFGISKEIAKLIYHKFRGNVGEINAEYFFKVFGQSIVSDYHPIIFENDLESFYDGEGVALDPLDDYPFWVQVKMQNTELKQDVVWRLSDVVDDYLRNHLDTNLKDFYSKKRCILYTFSDLKCFGDLRERYLKKVQIISTNEINKYFGKSYEGNWSTFCKIVLKNIEKVEV